MIQEQEDHTAYVGLGSNMGDAIANLAAACDAVKAFDGVTFMAASSVYKTEPQGMKEQPFFANQVLEIRCSPALKADTLLAMLLEAEKKLGRKRQESDKRYGPRHIDMDLLLFGNERISVPGLVLPHPRMLERAFVLVPLAEIAPDLVFPHGMTIAEALASISFTRRDATIYQDDSLDGCLPHVRKGLKRSAPA